MTIVAMELYKWQGIYRADRHVNLGHKPLFSWVLKETFLTKTTTTGRCEFIIRTYRLYNFWATVCQTVRPILSDRCLSVCLSVMLVYCGQTVWWIKMKLGTQVGLGPGHFLLDGNSDPPRKGAQQPPTFEIYGRRLCLHPYNPRPMSIVAKRLDGSRCH